MKVYDVLVIGSGVGGLETAAFLSKKGMHVLVLEKNKMTGGALQSFDKQGCPFSAGMHYAGTFDMGQTLQKFFAYLGIYDKLRLKRLDSGGFDVFNIGGKEYKYPIGYKAFEEQMNAYFPKEKVAVRTFISKIQEVAAYPDIYNLRTPVSNTIFDNPYFKVNFWDYVCSITNNLELRNVLAALNFVHAGEKEATPLYTHALILDHYLKSAYRFQGGSHQLISLLSEVILNNGGEILTNKKVVHLSFEDQHLAEVQTAKGEKFFAKKVISNVHPAVSLDFIDSQLLKPVYRNRLLSLENTISVFGLFIRLKKNGVLYRNYNEHFFKEKEVWPVSSYKTTEWPNFYFIYHHAPKEDSRYTRCMTILTYMKFEDVPARNSAVPEKSGNNYNEWKRRKASQLLQLVYQNHPLLEKQMGDYSIATPLTYQSYLGTPKGAMYGIKRDFKNALLSNIFPTTRIPNFFFTGQNINLHGLIGVSLSTLVTLSNFMNINQLINEINAS